MAPSRQRHRAVVAHGMRQELRLAAGGAPAPLRGRVRQGEPTIGRQFAVVILEAGGDAPLAAFDAVAQRRVSAFTARAWDIPTGCAAAYYPEASGLIAASVHSSHTQTPLYKEMPVRVTAA
jgi:hypothetical protein